MMFYFEKLLANCYIFNYFLQSIVDPETERTSTESKFSLMKGRTLQLDTVQVLSYNATMMYTENQRGATVSIIGTHTGQVHKVNYVSLT